MSKDLKTGTLNALVIARRGAVKARTEPFQQINDLLITTLADLCGRYRC